MNFFHGANLESLEIIEYKNKLISQNKTTGNQNLNKIFIMF